MQRRDQLQNPYSQYQQFGSQSPGFYLPRGPNEMPPSSGRGRRNFRNFGSGSSGHMNASPSFNNKSPYDKNTSYQSPNSSSSTYNCSTPNSEYMSFGNESADRRSTNSPDFNGWKSPAQNWSRNSGSPFQGNQRYPNNKRQHNGAFVQRGGNFFHRGRSNPHSKNIQDYVWGACDNPWASLEAKVKENARSPTQPN